jgi:hypothetical protein
MVRSSSKQSDGKHGAAAESAIEAPPALEGGEKQKHRQRGQHIPEDVPHVVGGLLRAHIRGALVMHPEERDDAHKRQRGEQGTEFVAAFHEFADERDDAGAEEVFEEDLRGHGSELKNGVTIFSAEAFPGQRDHARA